LFEVPVSGWLLILCLILTVWNPASLALRLAADVANLASRSWLSLLFLAIRLVITSIGVAAGLALFMRRPWAVHLAKVALMLFGIETVIRLSTRVDLSEAPPGTRLPRVILLLAHNAAWYLYLQKSRRVRALYGLESPPNP
jgi:hypothetical protein